MTNSVGLRWDLEARDGASRSFNIAAASAARLAEEANHALHNLDQLGRRSPDVRIRTNAPAAMAEIAALRREVDRLSASRDQLLRPPAGAGAAAGGAAAGGGGIMPWLLGAGAMVAPAAIPLAAVAAGGLGTLYLGAKSALNQLKQLTPEFHRLQAVAGKSLAPGVNSLINAATKLEGPLNGLIRTFGSAISGELTKFADYMNSGAATQFIDYAKKELPTVLKTVNAIGAALGHLVLDVAPFGDAIVRELGTLGNMVNDAAQIAEHIGEAAKNASGQSGLGTNLGSFLGIGPGNVQRNLEHAQHGLDWLNRASAPTVVSGQGAIAPSARIKAAAANAALTAKQLAGEALNAIRAQDAAVKSLTASYIGLRDAQLNVENLQLGFKAGLFGLSAAIKGNGHSLSENTAKGIANKQALVGLLTQAEAGAKASKNYGYTLLQNVKDFQKHAQAAGFSKGQIDKLLGSMHLMPSQIKSSVNVETAAAKHNLDIISRQIAELPTYKSVTVGVNFQTTHAPIAVGGSTYRSQVPTAPTKHAFGGFIGPNEVFTVGERGWEGGVSDSMGRVRIFSNAQARSMGFRSPTGYAAGTGGGRRVLRATFDLGELGRMVREVVLDELDYADSVGSLG
jgi:hypothetical protein